jgi:hypothetical protein
LNEEAGMRSSSWWYEVKYGDFGDFYKWRREEGPCLYA